MLVQRRGRPVEDVLGDYKVRDVAIDSFMTTFAAISYRYVPRLHLAVDNVEYQELVSKIMGFSDKTEIYILSITLPQ